MALSHFRRLFLVWALTAMVAAVQAGTGLAAEKNGATAQVSPVDALAKALGPENPGVTASLNSLGMLYQLQGRYLLGMAGFPPGVRWR